MFVVSGTEPVVIAVEGALARTATVGFLAVIDGVAGARHVTIDLERCTGIDLQGRVALRHAGAVIEGRGGVLAVAASVVDTVDARDSGSRPDRARTS